MRGIECFLQEEGRTVRTGVRSVAEGRTCDIEARQQRKAKVKLSAMNSGLGREKVRSRVSRMQPRKRCASDTELAVSYNGRSEKAVALALVKVVGRIQGCRFCTRDKFGRSLRFEFDRSGYSKFPCQFPGFPGGPVDLSARIGMRRNRRKEVGHVPTRLLFESQASAWISGYRGNRLMYYFPAFQTSPALFVSIGRVGRTSACHLRAVARGQLSPARTRPCSRTLMACSISKA